MSTCEYPVDPSKAELQVTWWRFDQALTVDPSLVAGLFKILDSQIATFFKKPETEEEGQVTQTSEAPLPLNCSIISDTLPDGSVIPCCALR